MIKKLLLPLLFSIFSMHYMIAADKPTGLICELLAHPELTVIENSKPAFGWIVNSNLPNDYQTACQVVVSTSSDNLRKDMGDSWDSGKQKTRESSNLPYNGLALKPHTTYFWKVRTWNRNNQPSAYSDVQSFTTGDLDKPYATSKYLQTAYRTNAVRIVRKPNANYFIDFGRAVFGSIEVNLTGNTDSVEIRLGEMLADSVSINVRPPATIRAYAGKLKIKKVGGRTVLDLPKFRFPSWAKPDEHVPVPYEIANVIPFRYCEIIRYRGTVDTASVRQMAVIYPFNDAASGFTSSCDTLNKIWDLCKHTIKATTFCGIYVDGDRERRPYEADAYINQLGHYCVDREYALARYSHEYFFEKPTWPTEWKSHQVMMAWQDYLYTGNKASLANFYDRLKREKVFLTPLNPDGLLMDTIHKGRKNDIVDWPATERDGYDLRDVNLVVNAFYYHAMVTMADIANALDKPQDATMLAKQAGELKNTINKNFFDPKRGLYIDAIGSTHTSLHANLFPVVFGLAEDANKPHIAEFIKSRGMACSVYGAQYLFEALYMLGDDQYALNLLTSASQRSWWNMIRSGSTMALEAWDVQFKPNLDWNHAWGAAPANLIPRCMFGIQPIAPGFERFCIKPQTANLHNGSMRLPTIKGTILVGFKNEAGVYTLDVEIPANTTAEVYITAREAKDVEKPEGVKFIRMEGAKVVYEAGSGKYRFVSKNVAKGREAVR